mmetsp:Transcript_135805/g.330120  ORF Transcript_135805/g.330120 Transcript_135805/m.330120 type:complete len:414 (+) Transcript_135805:1739-2980(+)
MDACARVGGTWCALGAVASVRSEAQVGASLAQRALRASGEPPDGCLERVLRARADGRRFRVSAAITRASLGAGREFGGECRLQFRDHLTRGPQVLHGHSDGTCAVLDSALAVSPRGRKRLEPRRRDAHVGQERRDTNRACHVRADQRGVDVRQKARTVAAVALCRGVQVAQAELPTRSAVSREGGGRSASAGRALCIGGCAARAQLVLVRLAVRAHGAHIGRGWRAALHLVLARATRKAVQIARDAVRRVKEATHADVVGVAHRLGRVAGVDRVAHDARRGAVQAAARRSGGDDFRGRSDTLSECGAQVRACATQGLTGTRGDPPGGNTERKHRVHDNGRNLSRLSAVALGGLRTARVRSIECRLQRGDGTAGRALVRSSQTDATSRVGGAAEAVVPRAAERIETRRRVAYLA